MPMCPNIMYFYVELDWEDIKRQNTWQKIMSCVEFA